MTHHYFNYFLLLIKISPLFMRLAIDRYWRIITRADPLDNDTSQAKVIGYILRAKKIHITDQRLSNLFKILPNHISIDSKERIPALLTQWNMTTTTKDISESDVPIDFSKAEVEKKLSTADLNDIQTPCLIRLNNGQAAALIDIAEGLGAHKKSFLIYHPDHGVQILSPQDFIGIWSGVLFDIDSAHAFKEPQFFDKNISEQWQYWCRPISIILTLLLILAVLHYQVTHFSGIALLIFVGITACLISGLALSLILAQHALGNISGTLAKYCSSGSANDTTYNCSDVLDSPNAKFLGISHADIGVAYFAGSLLLFLMSLLTVDAYPYIHSLNSGIIYLSLLAPIYSGYSIYLQKYRLKKWCILCLYTQVSVFLQALLVLIFLGFSHHTGQAHFSFLLSLVLLCIPAIIWHFLRAQLAGKTIQQEQQQQIESIIASDSNIQKILHAQQQRINSAQADFNAEDNAENDKEDDEEDDEDLEGDLMLSSCHSEPDNSQALRVVLGLSPSCLHCGSMLEEVYQFITNNNSAIECRIRLIVSEGESREAINDRIIAEHITAFVANAGEGSSVGIAALRHWYQDCKAQDVDQWLGSVRNISEDESIDISVLLADTSFWVSQKDISVIPALYIENVHIAFVSDAYSTILLRKIFLS
jgi:uncharacterized membrane protein